MSNSVHSSGLSLHSPNTGNPGPIGFYPDFMKEISTFNEHSIEVCGVSRAGHVVLPKDMQKPYSDIKRLVSETRFGSQVESTLM